MELIYSRMFRRQLKSLARRYRHIKSDLTPLLESLVSGETLGDQIIGTGHTLYKVRVKNSDNQKGKSGGYRVIYYLKTESRCVLLTLYSKSDQGDIEAEKLKSLVDEVNDSLNELKD
jgi:mRNA-degrading endonuclease RelE of RelBE toxin-antitoxin system